jgi:hypothetical protein
MIIGVAVVLPVTLATSLICGFVRGPILVTIALAALLLHGNGLLVTSLAALSVATMLLLDRRIRHAWGSIAKGLLVFAVLLLVLGIGRIVSVADRVAADTRGLPVRQLDGEPRPDIFIILLDGYPRTDMLQQAFHFDNGDFIDALLALGFDTYPDSRSNYPSTTLSVASTLQGRELTDLSLTQPELRHAAWDAPMVQVARARGYEFVSIHSGWDELSIRRADQFIDTGGIGQFEQSLVERNGLGWLMSSLAPDFFGDQRRDRIDGVLRTVREIGSKASEWPRLVWAHVPAPHYPNVYRADSARRVELEEFGGYTNSGQELANEYVANLRGLNDRVLATLSSPALSDAVVVIWSDHGSLTGLGPPEERVRNFLAARTPGFPSLFGQKPSPVQMLPMLWNAYLGTDLPVVPSRSFVFGGTRHELVRIEP